MIVSRTPLRISFVGGGTDFPRWYECRYGCVVGAAIDKYVHVMVAPHFEGKIRVAYAGTEELVDCVDDVQHDLIRECMKLTGVTEGVEIVTIADVPGKGTGLGSSSAVTVGVLNALTKYAEPDEWMNWKNGDLAKAACQVELDILGKPIGKQDQYLCALGGVNGIEFLGDGQVVPEKLWNHGADAHCGQFNWPGLAANLLLFYLGTTRDANEILKVQDEATDENRIMLSNLAESARIGRQHLLSGDFGALGKLMDRAWGFKTTLAKGIVTPHIQERYMAARRAGALGGKVCGAGGGGFMLLYVEPEQQAAVREALSDLKELEFKFDYEGTKILYADA